MCHRLYAYGDTSSGRLVVIPLVEDLELGDLFAIDDVFSFFCVRFWICVLMNTG